MMNNKIMVGALSMMLLGVALTVELNQPSIAAANYIEDRIEQTDLEKEATITRQQSIEIAQREVTGTLLKCKLDREHGIVVYEIEIKNQNGQVYEIEVDAKNGSILKIERDND